jgi:hypothetical protein
MYTAKTQKVHGQRTGTLHQGTSSRQTISLGFAANHRVDACRAANSRHSSSRHARDLCLLTLILWTIWLDRNNFSGTQRVRMRNKKASKGFPLSTRQAAICAVRVQHFGLRDPFNLSVYGITVTKYSMGGTFGPSTSFTTHARVRFAYRVSPT